MDVIPSANRYCCLEANGCASPLNLKMQYEGDGENEIADLSVYISLVYKEPSFTNAYV
jgi:hypothetical protein